MHFSSQPPKRPRLTEYQRDVIIISSDDSESDDEDFDDDCETEEVDEGNEEASFEQTYEHVVGSV